MSVPYAKVPFEHEKIAYIIYLKCQHPDINISYAGLLEEVDSDLSNLPYVETTDKDNHHPFARHGQHVVMIRHMQD